MARSDRPASGREIKIGFRTSIIALFVGLALLAGFFRFTEFFLTADQISGILIAVSFHKEGRWPSSLTLGRDGTGCGGRGGAIDEWR
jgi:hypothetical protein